MIGVQRIAPYRPCDWNCGRQADFEVNCDGLNEQRRLFACDVHLTVAVVAAVKHCDCGANPYPCAEQDR